MAFTVAFVLLAALASSVAAAPNEVVWCVPYDQPSAYARLCTKALAPANNDDVTFSCTVGLDTDGCLRKIQSGDAHVTTLDGGDMVSSHFDQGMIPLLFENYGVAVGASYFAVAAVRKEFCDATTTLESLKGARSCHTGYRKTAGWYSPLGELLSSQLMSPVCDNASVEDDAESVAGFFSSVCAPRVTSDGPRNGGQSWDKLCSHCAGDCTVNDPYYDYDGAFRCMADGNGDVAFIKHSTIPDFSLGGKSEASWAKDKADDFMLLCPSGGCKPVSEYATCHMAKVPAHAVVANGSFGVGGSKAALGKAIQDALVSAAQDASFLKSTVELAGQGNFVFKKGTVGLDAVTSSFEAAVGSQFLRDREAIENVLNYDC